MRLFRHAAIVFLVVLGLSGAAVIVGRAQPPAPLLPELHQCNSGMCLYTITPRQTTLDDAETVLDGGATFILSTISSRIRYKVSKPYYRVDLFPWSSGSNLLGELDLLFPDQANITAGTIIAEFGWPCAILPRSIPGRLVLKYPGMVVFFSTDGRKDTYRLDLSLPLREINLFDNFASCAQVRFDKANRPWRGFARY